MKRSLQIILLCCIVISALWLSAPSKVTAQAEPPQYPVVIYMFWGDGCPHCAVAKPFLQELAAQNPLIVLRFYEVWYVEENQQYFMDMAAEYEFEPSAVPTIMIGDKYWVGFGDSAIAQITDEVNYCLANGCPDRGVGIIPGVTAPIAPTAAAPTPTQAADPTAVPSTQMTGSEVLSIPLIGQVDLSKTSLWVSTALIGFVDGVNPCSIWVLTMLLALTLHTGSRKKVVLIGLIFLTVTAAIYGLFIAGLFTMFTVISFVWWIELLVSLVALFFGLVNIKDYFWYKEGLSFTIDDSKKPGIFQRMRRLMDASQSTWGLISGTVVLAAGVSLVEFSCTAGFPMLWTNLLVSQEVTTGMFIALLLLYLVIYQLDELAIFFVAVTSLKASKMEEKHGRILKLIGGVLMLTLAGVMLINPAAMNTISGSLVIFAIAFAVTVLILIVHRVILPRMGITIGTEKQIKRKRS